MTSFTGAIADNLIAGQTSEKWCPGAVLSEIGRIVISDDIVYHEGTPTPPPQPKQGNIAHRLLSIMPKFIAPNNPDYEITKIGDPIYGTLHKRELEEPDAVFAVPASRSHGIISENTDGVIVLWNTSDEPYTITEIIRSEVTGYTIELPTFPLPIPGNSGIEIRYTVLRQGTPAQSTEFTFKITDHSDVTYSFRCSRSAFVFANQDSINLGTITEENVDIVLANPGTNSRFVTDVEFIDHVSLDGYELPIDLPLEIPAGNEVTVNLLLQAIGGSIQNTDIVFTIDAGDPVTVNFYGTREQSVFLLNGEINAGIITTEQSHIVLLSNMDPIAHSITAISFSDQLGYTIDNIAIPCVIGANSTFAITITVLPIGRTRQNTTITITVDGADNFIITIAGERTQLIYLTPAEINCGEITTEQQYQITLWNADVIQHDLIFIRSNQTLGYSLSSVLPYRLAPNASVTLDLSVDMLGPTVQATTISFIFSALTVTLSVTGTRQAEIVLEPSTILCGEITENRSYTIKFFNWHIANLLLTKINLSPSDGISLDIDLPLVLPSLSETEILLTVLAAGPTSQNTTITFIINGQSYTLILQGKRTTITSPYSFYDKLLPAVLRQNDPNGAIKAIVDGAQQGFDELRTLALSLPKLIDLDQTPSNLLAYLAYLVGVQLESGDTEGLRREQIRSAIPVYKIKGTDLGYSTLLRTFGYEVEIFHLYETDPDSTVTKTEEEVITGFNERLSGWHAASKIRLFLYRLAEAENLEISGMTNGMLTSYLLQRLLEQIRSVTPIHIEVEIVFVWEFSDQLDLTDSQTIVFDERDNLALGSCCYHGKGADIVWERHGILHDSGVIFDDTAQHDNISDYAPARLHDSPYAHLDSDYSYHWDYPEYYHDLLPDVWRACCKRGEENAYNLTRWWYTKMSHQEMTATAGSDVVVFATALKPDVEVGDFVNLDYEYWRIVEIIDEHTVRVDRALPTSGTFECSIEWIESWHRRCAMHKETLDFTLPAYVRAVMPTYLVMCDIAGFNHDDSDLRFDMTGMKHDSCDKEQIDITAEPIVELLSAIHLEFAYYHEFPAGSTHIVRHILGTTDYFTVPADGKLIGMTISSEFELVSGTLTATPTVEGDSLDGVILAAGEDNQTIEMNENLFSGMRIGSRLTSSPDYSGGGSVFINLFLELE